MHGIRDDRRSSDEPISMRTYPEDGVRAVAVPTELVRVNLDSEVITGTAPSSSFTEKLSGGSQPGKFEAVRSMAIFCDHDLLLRDVYEDAVGLQAGWNPLQGIPEVERFRLDLRPQQDPASVSTTPDEVHMQLLLFNTDYVQMPPVQRRVRSNATRTGVTFNAGASTFETALVRPGHAWDQQRFTVENDAGSGNALDARLVAIDQGERFLASGPTTLQPGDDPHHFHVSSPAEYYLVEVASAGADADVAWSAVGGG